MARLLVFIIILLSNIACTNNKREDIKVEPIETKKSIKEKAITPQTNANQKLPEGNFKVVVKNKWYHDPNAYTQGLVYHNGYLYESTGNYGASSLRKIELETGKILKMHKLSHFHFAEGIAIFNNKIYQLTWQNRICFVYDLETFNLINTFSYDGEGWGLTNDKNFLIMSNGSHQISFINPENFKIVRIINVTEDSKKVDNLNELEYINGEIFANVFMTNDIVRINPENGNIVGRIDLTPLYKYLPTNTKAEVLNGIAYDPDNDRYFVTGKYWDYVFEIGFEKVE